LVSAFTLPSKKDDFAITNIILYIHIDKKRFVNLLYWFLIECYYSNYRLTGIRFWHRKWLKPIERFVFNWKLNLNLRFISPKKGSKYLLSPKTESKYEVSAPTYHYATIDIFWYNWWVSWPHSHDTNDL